MNFKVRCSTAKNSLLAEIPSENTTVNTIQIQILTV